MKDTSAINREDRGQARPSPRLSRSRTTNPGCPLPQPYLVDFNKWLLEALLRQRISHEPKTRKYILVGAATPQARSVQNPGGQLTASLGLIRYAETRGYHLKIIDTVQSSFPVPPFHRRLASGIKRAFSLTCLLREGGFEGVVIFASSGFSFYEKVLLSLICRLFRTRDLFFVRSGHFMNKVESSFRSRLLARILLKIPYLIGAQGKKWIQFYKSLGVEERKTVLVRNWLPESDGIVDKPKETSGCRQIRFIFVGWLVTEKGVNEILAAIKMLKSNNLSFQFTFVGGGTLEGAVHERIDREGWGEDVRAVGWKTSGEVKSLLGLADVFVLPSYSEGFPNALLEAMAQGLPAICTDVGGIPDSVMDGVNGFLVPPGEAEPIARAMGEYITRPDLINTHSAATLQTLRLQHEWQSNCEKIFSAFYEMPRRPLEITR